MSALWVLVAVLVGVCCVAGGLLSARAIARQQARPDLAARASLRSAVPGLALSGLGAVGVLTLYARGFAALAFLLIGLGVAGSLLGVALFRPKLGQ